MHEAFPLRRRRWCPGQEMTRSTDFMREPSLATAARKTTIDVCTPTGGRPAPPDRNCATGRAGGHFPRDAALFLSAESVQSPWRRELGAGGALPPKPENKYLRGASPPANAIAPGDATQGRRVTAQRPLTYSASHSNWPFLDGGSCGRCGE